MRPSFLIPLHIPIDESLMSSQHSNKVLGGALRIRMNNTNVANFGKKIEHTLQLRYCKIQTNILVFLMINSALKMNIRH